MNRNESLGILTAVSKNAGAETILGAIKASLEAAINKGRLSERYLERAVPLLRRVLNHPRASEEARIHASEAISLLEGKAAPGDILARLRTDASRLATANNLAAEVSPAIMETGKDASQSPEGVRVPGVPSAEILPANSGLMGEAHRLAEARRAPLHSDDVLRAMDARFPYDRPAPISRDLKVLCDELSVYMELDEILAQAEDASDPLKIGADHRIRLMKEVPDGPEPLWFRQLRWRCQIDLFFLARAVCGKRFTNYTHRPLCEHLVLKNPNLSIAEQDEVKDRLTMCFRGFFKSTASILDCVQWIIDFPNDIRVVILTSTLKLAKRFIGELKQYFMCPKGAQPTTFQMLFPEFVVLPEEHGPVNEFTIKGRRSVLKDPTAWAASIGSDDIGSHCDLLIFDDAESAENSATAETLETLAYKVNMARMLVDPGGFRSWIGTPYALNDIYFQMRNNIEGLKFFYKPVMAAKPQYASKDQADWTEEDVVLAFPERLPWKVIQAAKREDPGVFQSQYMLNPSGSNVPTFSLELLQAATVRDSDIPIDPLVHYAIWDLAYTLGRKSDSSVGVTASQCLTDGRVYVREIIQEKFLPEDQAEAIVDSYARHRHKVVIIEGSLGAENLRPTIERLARERGIQHIPLFFLPVNNRRNAKGGRVAALEPLLRSGRLLFSNAISCLTELYEQFHFFGTARHDDLPDCIGLLFESGYISQIPVPHSPDAMRRIQQAEQIIREHALYEHIFGTPKESPLAETPIQPEFDESEIYDPYAIPGMGGR